MSKHFIHKETSERYHPRFDRNGDGQPSHLQATNPISDTTKIFLSNIEKLFSVSHISYIHVNIYCQINTYRFIEKQNIIEDFSNVFHYYMLLSTSYHKELRFQAFFIFHIFNSSKREVKPQSAIKLTFTCLRTG